jgi:hypothetical protein
MDARIPDFTAVLKTPRCEGNEWAIKVKSSYVGTSVLPKIYCIASVSIFAANSNHQNNPKHADHEKGK